VDDRAILDIRLAFDADGVDVTAMTTAIQTLLSSPISTSPIT
jgi:hypothetical protein